MDMPLVIGFTREVLLLAEISLPGTLTLVEGLPHLVHTADMATAIPTTICVQFLQAVADLDRTVDTLHPRLRITILEAETDTEEPDTITTTAPDQQLEVPRIVAHLHLLLIILARLITLLIPHLTSVDLLHLPIAEKKGEVEEVLLQVSMTALLIALLIALLYIPQREAGLQTSMSQEREADINFGGSLSILSLSFHPLRRRV